MAWIRLHLKYDGREVYVNTKNINFINNDCREAKEVACVNFNGDDDNYISVTETVEEVMKQIVTNETTSMAVSAL